MKRRGLGAVYPRFAARWPLSARSTRLLWWTIRRRMQRRRLRSSTVRALSGSSIGRLRPRAMPEREARGDILFFVDADTLINTGVIQSALDNIRDGVVGGGCLPRF